ncbi:MAG: glutathione peroxidase [Gammaproteobacteria bacterium]
MLENREGDRIPNATFRTRENNEWENVTSESIFGGKTVVAFSLPGAFTPTCSSSHVPRYNELATVFRNNGVDEIVCISVNDAFTMNAWQQDQKADRIRFLPDGNGEFTKKMDMLVDKSELGFGMRSWRYSMLVRDGVIEKMFIEPQKEGDPFEISDADTMLRYINPEAELPDKVTLFARNGCPHCARAKRLLNEHGIDYEEITLGEQVTMSSVQAVTGAQQVPQVFMNGRLIGGADQLESYLGQKKMSTD